MVTIRSASRAWSSADDSAPVVSAATGMRRGTAPYRRASASSAHALLLRIWPGRSSASISTTSSPVGMIATVARGYASTSVTPTDASTPISAGWITRPPATTTSPTRTSPPARRTFAALGAESSTATSAPSARPATPRGSPRWPQSVRSVSSNGTIASAPGGIGAPVMMRAAVPASIRVLPAAPAWISPTTRSRTGRSSAASDTSAACSAYPS